MVEFICATGSTIFKKHNLTEEMIYEAKFLAEWLKKM